MKNIFDFRLCKILAHLLLVQIIIKAYLGNFLARKTSSTSNRENTMRAKIINSTNPTLFKKLWDL